MKAEKEDLMEVGKVIGFHGLKGLMKIDPYTEDPERFYELDSVLVDGKERGIEVDRIQKGKVFLYMEGVADRTAAERFRDKILKIPRSDAPELEEDEFYIVDLIGIDILDSETREKIGVLSDVVQTSGVVDNFAIKTKEKTVYVPALKEFFEMDTDTNSMLASLPEEYFNL